MIFNIHYDPLANKQLPAPRGKSKRTAGMGWSGDDEPHFEPDSERESKGRCLLVTSEYNTWMKERALHITMKTMEEGLDRHQPRRKQIGRLECHNHPNYLQLPRGRFVLHGEEADMQE